MRSIVVLVAIVSTSGALGDPFLPDEVPFESVERAHFDAIGVVLERAASTASPLTLRVHIVGDASSASIDKATAWLREHANIQVVQDARGAPLFLTNGDLAATSGRGTLGATVRQGMAIEMRDPRIAPCVVAHEILHFVGLKHVTDRRNIMYAHCSRDFLLDATMEPWQQERIATLSAIRATTPRGVEVWATR